MKFTAKEPLHLINYGLGSYNWTSPQGNAVNSHTVPIGVNAADPRVDRTKFKDPTFEKR